MKLITIPYTYQNVSYDYFTDKDGARIEAGTTIDVDEKRADRLLGNNPFNIAYARKLHEPALEELSREELIEKAKSLGVKFPANIKTINLINKIIEKQNS